MVYYDCKKESPQRVLGVRLISKRIKNRNA